MILVQIFLDITYYFCCSLYTLHVRSLQSQCDNCEDQQNEEKRGERDCVNRAMEDVGLETRSSCCLQWYRSFEAHDFLCYTLTIYIVLLIHTYSINVQVHYTLEHKTQETRVLLLLFPKHFRIRMNSFSPTPDTRVSSSHIGVLLSHFVYINIPNSHKV